MGYTPHNWESGEVITDEKMNALENAVYEASAANSNLAPDFDEAGTYYPPALVMHDGRLYECIHAHTASAWNYDHFSQVQISNELEGENWTDERLGLFYHQHGLQKPARQARM